jgi:ribosome-binding protein aMBF1 (putative translation factor)
MIATWIASTQKVDHSPKDRYVSFMMSPEQCRAARAWLGWSQQELAQRSRVGLSTVKDFERGDRKPMVNNLEAMRRAIEDGGMVLVVGSDGEPIGIARKPEGEEGEAVRN